MPYTRENDPNWDPIYGSDQGRQNSDNTIDSLTFGLAGRGAQSAREAATRTLAELEGPKYSEQGYQYAGDFNPLMYQNPEEASATLAQDSAEGRAAQLAALKALGEQSDQAVGSQQQLDRAQAMQDAAQFAQGREGMIRQDAARRGQIGGAADMIMRAQAAQDAANRNQMGGLQSAQMAALQRLAGTQAQAGVAGQLRGQDQNLSMSNADIINRFNLYNTGNRNQTRASNTDLRNNAALGNLTRHQTTSDKNTERGDMISGAKYAADASKASGLANAMQGQATGMQAQSGQQQQAAGTTLASIMKAIAAG